MKQLFDEQIKAAIEARAESVRLSDEQSSRILQAIHRDNNRRTINMFSKGKKVLVAAAAIAVLGTITVIGAGQVASYHSSSNSNEVRYANAQEVKQAEQELGAVPKAPQQFSNGLDFTRGNIIEVNMADENGVDIGSFPQLSIIYGDNAIYLSVEQVRNNQAELGTPVETRQVGDITLSAYADNYLFLPPDAEPDAADLALQEAGQLGISYGSAEEERQVYQYVTWTENGLEYLLSTFDGQYDLDTLLTMAEEVLAAQ